MSRRSQQAPVADGGEHLRIPPAIPTVAASSSLAFAVLGLAWIASVRFDRPFGDYTRDPATVVNERGCSVNECGLIGLTSNAGALTWAAAAGICLFVTLVLRLTAHRPARSSPYLYFGLLTTALLLDDVFLVHETRVGLAWPGERELLAVYAISVLAILWSFRAFLIQTSAWILGLALGFFGVSIAFDLLAAPNFLAEDGAKLFGIALWATFLIGTALVDVSRATQRPTE